MIFYNPLTGEVDHSPVKHRPRTCFVLTQLGGTKNPELLHMRKSAEDVLASRDIDVIDAASVTTGKDFLLKIWKLIYSVPMVVALVERYTPVETLHNIYYEFGIAQAMGKETMVVVGKDTVVPSDLMRTEYIPYDRGFDKTFAQFLDEYEELSGYYETISDQLDNNPVLAMDYLRRSFLISGDEAVRSRAQAIVEQGNFDGRARNSVEALLASF